MLTTFLRNFAVTNFRLWRLIAVELKPRFRAIPGDFGRSAVHQMTQYSPRGLLFQRAQLRSAFLTALRDGRAGGERSGVTQGGEARRGMKLQS